MSLRLPDHRPKSAPEVSKIPPILGESCSRGECLSSKLDPKQGSQVFGPGHSSSGSSRGDRRAPEDSLGDTDPWARKNLLCLDGGGVRGYSSLLILRALMIRIAELEKEQDFRSMSSVHPLTPRPRKRVRVGPSRKDTTNRTVLSEAAANGSTSPSMEYLPAHYFDYVAGTSTGGLIAIMLGRLHMSVDECLETYEDLAERVFAHPRRFHIRKPPWIPRDKYSHEALEKVIKEIVKQRDPSALPSTEFRQSNEKMCRTIVTAWRKFELKGVRQPYLFRSYRHPKCITGDLLERNPDEPNNYKIWEVGRATSAAPSYFKSIKLEDDDTAEYIDGGFGANNPAEEAYRSVKQLSGRNDYAVKNLVSIGTGKNLESHRNPSAGYALYLRYANAAAKWATESEATHERVYEWTQGKAQYTRLNVEHGLGKMKLDEWKGKRGRKTLDLLRCKTQVFLSSDSTQAEIAATAQRLVSIRRARSEWQPDPDRWEIFCHGVEYACPVDACHHGGDRFPERRNLHRHIEEIHQGSYDAGSMEALLDRGKIFPRETKP